MAVKRCTAHIYCQYGCGPTSSSFFGSGAGLGSTTGAIGAEGAPSCGRASAGGACTNADSPRRRRTAANGSAVSDETDIAPLRLVSTTRLNASSINESATCRWLSSSTFSRRPAVGQACPARLLAASQTLRACRVRVRASAGTCSRSPAPPMGVGAPPRRRQRSARSGRCRMRSNQSANPRSVGSATCRLASASA